MFKLISATPSPYARKVRIQLAEKGIPFELITEVPWNSDTQTPLHNPPKPGSPVAATFSADAVNEHGFSVANRQERPGDPPWVCT